MQNYYATKKGNWVHRDHVIKKFRSGNLEVACGCSANTSIGCVEGAEAIIFNFDQFRRVRTKCESQQAAIDYVIDNGEPCRWCGGRDALA